MKLHTRVYLYLRKSLQFLGIDVCFSNKKTTKFEPDQIFHTNLKVYLLMTMIFVQRSEDEAVKPSNTGSSVIEAGISHVAAALVKNETQVSVNFKLLFLQSQRQFLHYLHSYIMCI